MCLPGRHAVFGQERNLKNLGAGEDYFLAGGGHSLPGDPVHLVEGVRPQVAVVRSADEHLQVDGLLAVAKELRHRGGGRKRNFNSRKGSPSGLKVRRKKTELDPGLHFYFAEGNLSVEMFQASQGKI